MATRAFNSIRQCIPRHGDLAAQRTWSISQQIETEDIMAKAKSKKQGAESVYRITELVGTSTVSWEDAAARAIETAAGLATRPARCRHRQARREGRGRKGRRLPRPRRVVLQIRGLTEAGAARLLPASSARTCCRAARRAYASARAAVGAHAGDDLLHRRRAGRRPRRGDETRQRSASIITRN